MYKSIIALGTNLGNREYNIKKAIDLINKKIGLVEKISSFYETKPVGFVSENGFLNAVIIVKTKLGVYKILKITQQIEKTLGRTQKSKNGIYRDRIIDIDIISYSNLKIKNKKLTIPHPKMHLRKFVLEPLSEVSPNFYHIILHQKIENLLQKLL